MNTTSRKAKSVVVVEDQTAICELIIEMLEAEQSVLTAKLGDPLFFKKPAVEVTKATARLHEIEAQLATAYARWSELEG